MHTITPRERAATAEPVPRGCHARRLADRFAHSGTWLASCVFVAAWTIGLLTRLALLVAADGAPTSLAAWLAIVGRGALVDALFAGAFAAALLPIGALTHGARPHGAARAGKRIVGLAIVVFALLFTAVAEWLFWDEFNTRFNFIAVDYLIYTTEVIGNIRESYPVGPIIGAIATLALGVAVLATRVAPPGAAPPWRARTRLAVAALGIAAAVGAVRLGLMVHDGADTDASLRAHAAQPELARNGPIAFIAALRDNALPFRRFYATVEPDAIATLAGAWPRPWSNGAAPVRVALPAGGAAARPRNVIVIQVESLSAEYLGAFGSSRGLTPNLDRIAAAGVLFTNLYAIGTRTVRGLEALSAALPPLPGQSIVRRPDNAGLLTLGGVLRENGFRPQFLYGGYGMFDNMNAWFEGSGYAVRDRSDLPPDPKRFGNIWGVADEHLFDEALATIEREAGGGRRLFLHLMTTSNHRPYTYPDGRIDIPSKTGRDGAVKYTDWAIGRFIEQARVRPWFDDTLFIIVADHCASVAGRTRLPPDRYHIPAIFYAPSHLAPRRIEHLASQIDLAPTLLSWLGIDDGGRFLGQDLFGAHVEQRAFLGNYQEIGLLVPSQDGGRDLVVLAPRRRVSQFRVDVGGSVRAAPLERDLARSAIARFQQADDLISGDRYRLRNLPADAPATTTKISLDLSEEDIHDAVQGGRRSAAAGSRGPGASAAPAASAFLKHKAMQLKPAV